MKILSINTYTKPYNFHFAQNEKPQSIKTNSNTKKAVIAGLGISAAVVGGIIIHRNTKAVKTISTTQISETSKKYYESIIESLKKDGIKVTVEDLKSIVTPDQFIELVKKFNAKHFRVGKQISEKAAENMPLEKFYKNAIDGNFRVSLHTHSNFSDGKASPEEFLDCARKYADKVAKMNKNDDLPPFTIALTDHDCVEGCAEIIKLIVKNPDKYKNLKFVAGCEFSVRNGHSHHDITGLALNPFDKDLRKTLSKLVADRRKTVQEFLDTQPEYKGKKVTIEDLAEFEKQSYAKHNKDGKRSIENGSGIVSVRHAIKFFYKYTKQKANNDTINRLGDTNILPIETVVGAIKQNGGYASLTHPLKSFWRYIGDENLDKLKKLGVDGIEVNHQYTPSKVTKLGEYNRNVQNADNLFAEITEQYKNYAEKNNMFLSGGTDCHEKQIFSRQPVITKDFLENKLLS